jgi:erythromycin esterase-like protein
MLRSRGTRLAPVSEEVVHLSEQVRQIAHPLNNLNDLDPLIDRIGNAHYVLLGEASHGTSEYYLWRARISQRLIQEKGFSFIAVEGDWPDCYSANRYIKGYPDSGDNAWQVLHQFERWPTWMWANWEIVALVEWLRRYNDSLTGQKKIGFYGLDVYSLWDSMRAIMEYLKDTHPEAVPAAARALRCFEPFGEDVQEYAWSSAFAPTTCEDDVIRLLTEIRARVRQYPGDPEDAFNAEQNAFVAVNAERYYRAMVRGGAASWNVRDFHMADTLDRLMQYHGPEAKGIVWEHNTHIGDARATDMTLMGQVNIGQLARERHQPEDVVLVGFGGHRGSVIAGVEWGASMERMTVPPGEQGSWEDIMHRASEEDKLLILSEAPGSYEFSAERGHRAIGVVYRPELEQFGNYVPTSLNRRYDAFLSIDETHALHPLHIEPVELREMPETYPWGL